ncbi:hypothetical protein D3C85_1647640 [compost metagenome]
MQRVHCFVAGGVDALLQAVDDAGLDGAVVGMRGHHRVKAVGGFFQLLAVGLDVGGQLDAEIIQREFAQCDGFVEVFQIQHFVLEP